MTCAQMTAAMKSGDEAAWREFHNAQYSWLISAATHRATPTLDASEIVQLTYLRAVRHIKAFADEAQLRNWLLCLMRCVIIDHARQVKRRSLLMEKFQHWQQTTAEPAAPSNEHDIDDVLLDLPQSDSRLLQRKYIEGWTTRELAQEANATPKAIESKLARLRKQLRSQLTIQP